MDTNTIARLLYNTGITRFSRKILGRGRYVLMLHDVIRKRYAARL